MKIKTPQPAAIAARHLSARLPADRASGFEVRNAAGDEAEVMVYDEIGFWGVEAGPFIEQLNAITAPTIHLRINSPGGGVFDALAMFNALKRHPARVVGHVDGIAASAASYLLMAADEIHMGEGTFLMIHDAIAVAFGNASDMRSVADVLEKISDEIAGIYSRRSGRELADVKAWMAAETWFTADEAVEAGLADEADAEAPAEVSNRFDMSHFRNAPDALRPETPAVRLAERALRDAGAPRSQAKKYAAIAAAAIEGDQAEALRDAERTAERERVAQVRDLLVQLRSNLQGDQTHV